MQILPGDVVDLATMVAFIADLNSDSADHIGYFGTHPVEITSTLQVISPPLSDRTYAVAYSVAAFACGSKVVTI